MYCVLPLRRENLIELAFELMTIQKSLVNHLLAFVYPKRAQEHFLVNLI